MIDNQQLLLTTPLRAFFDPSLDPAVITQLSQAVAKETVLDFLDVAHQQGLYANLEVGELGDQTETAVFELYHRLLEENVPLFISILVERKKTAIVSSYRQQLADLEVMTDSLSKPVPVFKSRLQRVQQVLGLLERDELEAVLAVYQEKVQ